MWSIVPSLTLISTTSPGPQVFKEEWLLDAITASSHTNHRMKLPSETSPNAPVPAVQPPN